MDKIRNVIWTKESFKTKVEPNNYSSKYYKIAKELQVLLANKMEHSVQTEVQQLEQIIHLDSRETPTTEISVWVLARVKIEQW